MFEILQKERLGLQRYSKSTVKVQTTKYHISSMDAKTPENLTLIKTLRKRLAGVSVSKVASEYGTAKSTLYFLLNEDRADIVNLEALAKLAAAIKKVEQQQKKKRPTAEQILKTLSQ